ncbi:MAG TPA: hypothetical protein VGM06_25470 [Polyangiaceae bacterium]|jgi:hypothetical protein
MNSHALAPVAIDRHEAESSPFLARRRLHEATEALDRVYAEAVDPSDDERVLAKAYYRGVRALHDVAKYLGRLHVETALAETLLDRDAEAARCDR